VTRRGKRATCSPNPPYVTEKRRHRPCKATALMGEWLAALAFLGISVATALTFIAVGKAIGVRARRDSPFKRRAYECGVEPVGDGWVQFNARYYLVALFFVLFDVEAVFLFPWAVVVRSLGVPGLVAITLFVAILMLGWLYGIRKDALRWQ
jgi:NADH-quinone oxidoreductase subunit A